MADTLCGPSNALQNFQKHTTVDRTLQQDRLSSRRSPAQGFRSSPGPNAGILDPEFEAFQASHTGPLQPDLHFHQPTGFAPQFAPASSAPDWASDFQRLNITPQPPTQSQRHFSSQTGNATSSSSSWHQDFIGQQAPQLRASTQQYGNYGGMPGPSMAWSGMRVQQQPAYGTLSSQNLSSVAQGKQRVQDSAPQFDEAAFERAFAQAHEDVLEAQQMQSPKDAEPVESSHTQAFSDHSLQSRDLEPLVKNRTLREQDQRPHMDEAVEADRARQAIHLQEGHPSHALVEETDPILLRIREKRPAVYGVMKLRSEIDANGSIEAIPWLGNLEELESTGQLGSDFSETRWCIETLEKVVDRTYPEVKARAERLITRMNQRLMSTYPLMSAHHEPINQNFWQELEAAGYVRSPVLEHMDQRPEQQEQQQEDQNMQHDDDEMAETAGKLLERVADNTSEKFQNSQFLELMRRLRDREVRVEGDKMVEVSSEQSSVPVSAQESTVPAVDPSILRYAVQDFGFPMDSEQEINSATTMSTRHIIDERIPPYEQDLDLGRTRVT